MTDTETRLRDYLHSQAATVPDSAQGPGLDSVTRRAHWPVLAAAAAVVVVAVLAASLLTRSGDRTEPARTPAPPVSGAAPQVPYTVSTGKSAALHDGKQTVPLPKGVDGYFFGRAGGGWLGSLMPGIGQFQPGILLPSGTFRPLGPPRSDGQHLSPDHKQLALYRYLSNTRGQVIVVDVASGKQIAQLPAAPGRPDILGWNQDGIWLNLGRTGIVVWKPSTGEQRRISIPGYNDGAAIPATAGVVAVTAQVDGKRCLRAGALRDDGFKVLRDYCDDGPEHLYPLLSPDGRTMVQSARSEAIDVNSGRVTKLDLPGRMTDALPSPVFEDATRLLTLTEKRVGNELRQQLFRCDVTSGECKLLFKDAGHVTIHEQ